VESDQLINAAGKQRAVMKESDLNYCSRCPTITNDMDDENSTLKVHEQDHRLSKIPLYM
jgi:hypothetical protein